MCHTVLVSALPCRQVRGSRREALRLHGCGDGDRAYASTLEWRDMRPPGGRAAQPPGDTRPQVFPFCRCRVRPASFQRRYPEAGPLGTATINEGRFGTALPTRWPL